MARKFAHIVAEWTKRLGEGSESGKAKPAEIEKNVPQGIAMLGCAFQICYIRKIASNEKHPNIWGSDL